ncbi:MAG: phosphoenolpyruvate-protein phosphotransferase [bacterium]|nr:phosphoenolpyruvate-protein phosphotransferase [bacterium]
MVLKGIGVSTGVARGTAYVLVAAHRLVVPRREIGSEEVAGELDRLEAALVETEADLLALEKSLAKRIGARDADIFRSQALLVRSTQLLEPVRALVSEQRLNVEAALFETLERLVREFEAIPDVVFRERAADIRDVGKRLLSVLQSEQREGDGAIIPEHAILVAEELLPSVMGRPELQYVAALVSERGGRSSHASILARAQGMPAVTGIAGAATQIKTGDPLIVDGIAGVVFVHPDGSVQREYQRMEAEIRSHHAELEHLIDLPCVTLDGAAIPLLANISKYADTEAAFRYNADGIGLYRTEFGFAIRAAFPTDDEQYEFLARAAERFHPRPLVLRLLDLGGDKDLSYFPLPVAHNPSLAQRGIRLLLEHPEILKTQLRAFLRVSADHPVQILLPVVGGLEEVRRTRAIVRQVQDELDARGVRFNRETPIGAMIEVPAAALLASALAREVDFFSLGTNDLVQYVLAADREDEGIANYYQPLHPAVLRLIQSVAEAARAADRELTICGEMAGNPAYAKLLLGLGLRRFSVAPGQMLEVKNAIRSARLDEAEGLARRALELGSVSEIEALVAGRP